MKINKLITVSLVSGSLALSSAVSQAKEQVQKGVYQLVGNELIPTTMEILKDYKTKGCVEFSGAKIYISDEKNVIPTGFYFDIKDSDVKEIKNSPKCKNK